MRQRTMLSRVVIVCVAAASALTACSGGESNDEVTVSLSGVNGARVNMSYSEARDRLGLRALVFPADGASGASDAIAPICEGAAEGFAVFWAWPPTEGAKVAWDDGATLESVWYFAGVRTEEGLRIGARASDLRKAYGDRLEPEELGLLEYLPGYADHMVKVVARTAPPRSA